MRREHQVYRIRYTQDVASGPLIRQRRESLGLTQGQLAARAATSRTRINSYEKERVHPTADTLARILDAMGLELGAVPKLTYEERRSLAISTAVATKLLADPDGVIGKARSNTERMRAAASHEHAWISLWEALLDLGVSYVAEVLTSKEQFARDLRQSSPFAGVLTDEERAAAVRGLRR